jgi:hypothetical protein
MRWVRGSCAEPSLLSALDGCCDQSGVFDQLVDTREDHCTDEVALRYTHH